MTAKLRKRAIAKAHDRLSTFESNRFVNIMYDFGGKDKLSKEDVKHYEWRKRYGKRTKIQGRG